MFDGLASPCKDDPFYLFGYDARRPGQDTGPLPKRQKKGEEKGEKKEEKKKGEEKKGEEKANNKRLLQPAKKPVNFHNKRRRSQNAGPAPKRQKEKWRHIEQTPPALTFVELSKVAEFVVFDTETSGLSNKDCIVQLALGFYAAKGNCLGSYSRLWKLPPDVHISNRAAGIHRIQDSQLREEGCDAIPELKSVLTIMRTMRDRKKRIIAHHVEFDHRMLARTYDNHIGPKEWDVETSDMFCTMKNAKRHCNCTDKLGRLKAPTNSELFECLTGEAPTGPLHDALADIMVLARSYVEGGKLGWW